LQITPTTAGIDVDGTLVLAEQQILKHKSGRKSPSPYDQEVALWFLDKDRTTDYNNLDFVNGLHLTSS
jgi:hypothetical protein